MSNNVRLGRWSSRRLRPIANTRQYLCSFWAAYVLPQRSTNVGLSSPLRTSGPVTTFNAIGRVRMWRGGLRYSLSVTAPFVWRCLISRTVTPFPHPPHRTGRALLTHPALGQDSCLRTRKVIGNSPDLPHGAVSPRRPPIRCPAHNRPCHHLGEHSLPGSQPGFFLHFST